MINSHLIYTASITPDIADKGITCICGLKDILINSPKAELMTVAIDSKGNEATLVID